MNTLGTIVVAHISNGLVLTLSQAKICDGTCSNEIIDDNTHMTLSG